MNSKSNTRKRKYSEFQDENNNSNDNNNENDNSNENPKKKQRTTVSLMEITTTLAVILDGEYQGQVTWHQSYRKSKIYGEGIRLKVLIKAAAKRVLGIKYRHLANGLHKIGIKSENKLYTSQFENMKHYHNTPTIIAIRDFNNITDNSWLDTRIPCIDYSKSKRKKRNQAIFYHFRLRSKHSNDPMKYAFIPLYLYSRGSFVTLKDKLQPFTIDDSPALEDDSKNEELQMSDIEQELKPSDQPKQSPYLNINDIRKIPNAQLKKNDFLIHKSKSKNKKNNKNKNKNCNVNVNNVVLNNNISNNNCNINSNIIPNEIMEIPNQDNNSDDDDVIDDELDNTARLSLPQNNNNNNNNNNKDAPKHQNGGKYDFDDPIGLLKALINSESQIKQFLEKQSFYSDLLQHPAMALTWLSSFANTQPQGLNVLMQLQNNKNNVSNAVNQNKQLNINKNNNSNNKHCNVNSANDNSHSNNTSYSFWIQNNNGKRTINDMKAFQCITEEIAAIHSVPKFSTYGNESIRKGLGISKGCVSNYRGLQRYLKDKNKNFNEISCLSLNDFATGENFENVGKLYKKYPASKGSSKVYNIGYWTSNGQLLDSVGRIQWTALDSYWIANKELAMTCHIDHWIANGQPMDIQWISNRILYMIFIKLNYYVIKYRQVNAPPYQSSLSSSSVS